MDNSSKIVFSWTFVVIVIAVEVVVLVAAVASLLIVGDTFSLMDADNIVAVAASCVGAVAGDNDVAADDEDNFLGLGKRNRLSLEGFFFFLFAAAATADDDKFAGWAAGVLWGGMAGRGGRHNDKDEAVKNDYVVCCETLRASRPAAAGLLFGSPLQTPLSRVTVTTDSTSTATTQQEKERDV